MIKKLFSFFFDRSLLIFLIIGGLNTIVSMIGSQLLLSALGYWGSTALMFALCSILSFIFNRKYSFQSTAPLVPSAVRFSIVIAVCYLVSFGISDLLVPWAARALAPAGGVYLQPDARKGPNDFHVETKPKGSCRGLEYLE